MTTVDVASNEIFPKPFCADAALWRQACQKEEMLQQRIGQLEAQLYQQSTLVDQLNQQINALKYQLVWMAQQIFGRKSEISKTDSKDDSTVQAPLSDSPKENVESQRDFIELKKRGKQKGSKGCGRKRRLNLPFKEIVHDLADDEKFCPQCRLPLKQQSITEDSEQIHWEVKILRHVHRRTCYKPICSCKAVGGIVTAASVAKLIPKGMFTEGFWVQLILEKFLFQRPLYRIRQMLALEGFDVSQGTLTGGLKKIKALVQPLYDQIIQRSRSANHWQMDETRWMVFQEMAGKTGFRWWLWVVVTKDTVVYLLDPSRSSKVPKEHLTDAQGILNVDRYSAYKALSALILLSYCWTHQRRDFIRIRDGYCHSAAWANDWIHRIDELFYINGKRCKSLDDPQAFNMYQQKLQRAINKVAESWQQQLADDSLPLWEKAALKSMKSHWTGLTIFVDHPEVPMDNNESERRLRNPIVGRKNYYGSGSVWSGGLCAMLFTILQTCCMNRIDPKQLLLAYFKACAENRGRVPQDIESFVSWNLSEENRHGWRLNDAFP